MKKYFLILAIIILFFCGCENPKSTKITKNLITPAIPCHRNCSQNNECGLFGYDCVNINSDCQCRGNVCETAGTDRFGVYCTCSNNKCEKRVNNTLACVQACDRAIYQGCNNSRGGDGEYFFAKFNCSTGTINFTDCCSRYSKNLELFSDALKNAKNNITISINDCNLIVGYTLFEKESDDYYKIGAVSSFGCIRAVSIAVNNESICNYINETKAREPCIKNSIVGQARINDDINICNKLLNQSEKKECIRVVNMYN